MDFFRKAKDFVEEKVEDAGGADKVADQAKDAYNRFSDKEGGDQAQEAAGEGKEQARRQAQDWGQQAEDQAGDVGEQARRQAQDWRGGSEDGQR